MRRSHAVLLVFAIFAVSAAAVLVVLSGMQAESIAVWRLGATTLAFAPFAWPRLRAELAGLSARQRASLVVAGIAYGLHFVWWPMGFEETTYESCVLILATHPVVGGVLAFFVLGEQVTRRMWAATAVAAVGLAVLVAEDYAFHPENLWGDAIVLASVFAIVVTVIAGRRLRQLLSFSVYVAAISGVALVVALGAALVGDADVMYTTAGTRGWIALALLLAIPTLFGHTAFHYLVKYTPVFYLNLVIVAEPIIAIACKLALRSRFEEFQTAMLSPLQGVGAALLLLGVGYGLAQRDEASEEAV